jgi:hypothetical protein
MVVSVAINWVIENGCYVGGFTSFSETERGRGKNIFNLCCGSWTLTVFT